jgi:hypothetical protein
MRIVCGVTGFSICALFQGGDSTVFQIMQLYQRSNKEPSKNINKINVQDVTFKHFKASITWTKGLRRS